MTDSARAMLKVGVKYGLAGSLAGMGLFLAMKLLGENPLIWTAPKLIAYCLLFLAFPLLAIVEFRRYHQSGEWKFWQGMALAVLVYGLISVSTSLLAGLVMQFDPEMLRSYQEVSLQSLESNRENFISQFGEEQYAQTEDVILATTAGEVALDDLLKKLIIGFFLAVTLVLALSIVSSLQKRNPSNQ